MTLPGRHVASYCHRKWFDGSVQVAAKSRGGCGHEEQGVYDLLVYIVIIVVIYSVLVSKKQTTHTSTNI